MAKTNLTKKYNSYYFSDLPSEIVSIKYTSFLTISGQGDQSSQVFSENVKALYAVAHGVKFLSKLRERDFVIPKLEDSWSCDEIRYPNTSTEDSAFKIAPNAWYHILRIRMPDFVFKKEVLQALDVARLKNKVLPKQEIIFEEIPSHHVANH